MYNDTDNSLVNIFETLRNNRELLKSKLNYSLSSSKLFNDYKNDSNNKYRGCIQNDIQFINVLCRIRKILWIHC